MNLFIIHCLFFYLHNKKQRYCIHTSDFFLIALLLLSLPNFVYTPLIFFLYSKLLLYLEIHVWKNSAWIFIHTSDFVDGGGVGALFFTFLLGQYPSVGSVTQGTVLVGTTLLLATTLQRRNKNISVKHWIHLRIWRVNFHRYTCNSVFIHQIWFVESI